MLNIVKQHVKHRNNDKMNKDNGKNRQLENSGGESGGLRTWSLTSIEVWLKLVPQQ
jgi:hypothetical protein